MKNLLIIMLAALAMGGCATIAPPTVIISSDPLFHPEKNASYAFLPEEGMRTEKRLFLRRAEAYLRKAGLRVAPPSTADYLIGLRIAAPRTPAPSLSVEAKPQSSVTPHLPSTRESISISNEIENVFRFSVYKRIDTAAEMPRSLWDATVYSSQREFRDNEEVFVTRVFQYIGESYEGPLSSPPKNNHQPEPKAASGSGS